MSKKHFIALAQYIMDHQRYGKVKFTDDQLDSLANFCRNQNGNFKRDRWLGYIKGQNGPNGGKV